MIHQNVLLLAAHLVILIGNTVEIIKQNKQVVIYNEAVSLRTENNTNNIYLATQVYT